MINLRPVILSTLKNDATLTGMLGGQRIYYQIAPKANEFPRITFFEIDNSAEDYADDKEYSSNIAYQIDIWNQEKSGVMRNPEIADSVNRVLVTLGFERNLSRDFFEEDTKVHHTVMRFTTIIEV